MPLCARRLSIEARVTVAQVGIEDCLHIEFEYNKTKYHLKDVVIGKIYFLLVRLKIKHMELEVRRRESTGTGSDMYNESETITKFEIMDGAPVRGECVRHSAVFPVFFCNTLCRCLFASSCLALI